jgi:hypothetical protein
MIKLKIDVTKISKPDLYKGKKGIYLNLALFTNKDGRDEYGNDGFIVQEIPKAEREAGRKGPIIGNWNDSGDQPAGQQAQRPPAAQSAPPAGPGGLPF